MNKDEYLKKADVVKYINVIVATIKGDAKFCHCYYDVDRKEKVKFTSLNDACSKYYYMIHESLRGMAQGNGHGIEENNKVLINLQSDMRSAFKEGNSELLLDACKKVMKWGGTVNKNNDELDRLHNNGLLVKYFEHVKELVDQYELSFTNEKCKAFERSAGRKLISNAGFTKLYSLLFDNFVIYDSRVAAALGWIYVLYSDDRSIPVQDNLRFYCMPARGGQNRNPSFHGNRFVINATGCQAHSSHHAHFDSNIKANWILEKVVKDCEGFCGKEGGEALRHLESALFMIGYDIPHPCVNSEFPPLCPGCSGSHPEK